MATFVQRVTGAAKLDARIFEEVETDVSATGQAVGVVLLSSIGAGIGAFGTLGLRGLLSGVIGSFLGWFLWAWLTYFIGTRILPSPQTRADWMQLLRTTGFATAPGILGVLGFFPVFRGFIFFVTSLWSLIAFVVAVRQALDYTSTLRALCVCAIGWIIYVAMISLLLGIWD